MDDKPPIWEAFSKGLGAEYRPAKEIQGASGLQALFAIFRQQEAASLSLFSSERTASSGHRQVRNEPRAFRSKDHQWENLRRAGQISTENR
ncbi:hypothetical protein [Mesorhizobium sp. M7A.F.Ca.MR.362.00.0.0]|uniref:hypothetical protein n=1 Tax=Mesorhizobium sp. M7A.F.Ca.MR.362.00.0.0 TaxID=2496779 RepID=UPI000FD4E317|nr:hypothetical protein [Mesorhizobium sp. M7A.F.Ca.MR.362.00.0.0]RUU82751.1 hypothetical protein EOC06_02875 [Mesorhizobium sp. M7A.F.Ca.MR.362.00.0.0]RWN96579.1 MAG: hypothetical protein EOS05_01140 [Mesorhizobium sp.]